MKDVVVIGSGGFSKQVIEIIEELNKIQKQFNLIGIIDDNKKLIGCEILGYKVIGNTDYLREYSYNNQVFGVIAIADGRVRKAIADKLNKINWVNLIHPSAVISKYTKIGIGNIICAGTIINPEFSMGNHCHINIGSTLGHDISIYDFVTIMPGGRISGNVILETNSLVGTGSIITQGLTIEKNVILGAGALVIKNIPANCTAVGSPAKPINFN